MRRMREGVAVAAGRPDRLHHQQGEARLPGSGGRGEPEDGQVYRHLPDQLLQYWGVHSGQPANLDPCSTIAGSRYRSCTGTSLFSGVVLETSPCSDTTLANSRAGSRCRLCFMSWAMLGRLPSPLSSLGAGRWAWDFSSDCQEARPGSRDW